MSRTSWRSRATTCHKCQGIVALEVDQYANIQTDFQSVDHWEDNKLDRTQNSRMGWSDVALSLSGPVVQDLRTHFTQRWNFIWDGNRHMSRLPVSCR